MVFAREELEAIQSSDSINLFLGSGVSIPYGLPSWEDLLWRLCAKVKSGSKSKKAKSVKKSIIGKIKKGQSNNGANFSHGDYFFQAMSEITDHLPEKEKSLLNLVKEELTFDFLESRSRGGFLSSLPVIISTLVSKDYKVRIFTSNYDDIVIQMLSHLHKLPGDNFAHVIYQNDTTVWGPASAKILYVPLYGAINSVPIQLCLKLDDIKRRVTEIASGIVEYQVLTGANFVVGYGDQDPALNYFISALIQQQKQVNNRPHNAPPKIYKISTAFESKKQSKSDFCIIPAVDYDSFGSVMESIAYTLPNRTNNPAPPPRFCDPKSDVTKHSTASDDVLLRDIPTRSAIFELLARVTDSESTEYKENKKVFIVLKGQWGIGKTDILQSLGDLLDPNQLFSFSEIQENGNNGRYWLIDGFDETGNIDDIPASAELVFERAKENQIVLIGSRSGYADELIHKLRESKDSKVYSIHMHPYSIGEISAILLAQGINDLNIKNKELVLLENMKCPWQAQLFINNIANNSDGQSINTNSASLWLQKFCQDCGLKLNNVDHSFTNNNQAVLNPVKFDTTTGLISDCSLYSLPGMPEECKNNLRDSSDLVKTKEMLTAYYFACQIINAIDNKIGEKDNVEVETLAKDLFVSEIDDARPPVFYTLVFQSFVEFIAMLFISKKRKYSKLTNLIKKNSFFKWNGLDYHNYIASRQELCTLSLFVALAEAQVARISFRQKRIPSLVIQKLLASINRYREMVGYSQRNFVRPMADMVSISLAGFDLTDDIDQDRQTSSISLTNLNLDRSSLTGLSARSANAMESSMNYANLENCTISSMAAPFVNMRGMKFKDVKMPYAGFSYADMRNVEILSNGQSTNQSLNHFSSSNFYSARVSGTQVNDSSLSDSLFGRTEIHYSNFTNCGLNDCLFTGASIRNTKFTDCNFDDSAFIGCNFYMVEFIDCSFVGVVLFGCEFFKSRCKLEEVNDEKSRSRDGNIKVVFTNCKFLGSSFVIGNNNSPNDKLIDSSAEIFKGEGYRFYNCYDGYGDFIQSSREGS